MIYLIWLTLLVLVTFAYLTSAMPIWVPLTIYVLVLLFRIKEKIGNYNDWKEKNSRDEKLKIEEVQNDLERRGLLMGGTRIKQEKKAHEDFEYERRKQKRQFENELINCLFLK